MWRRALAPALALFLSLIYADAATLLVTRQAQEPIGTGAALRNAAEEGDVVVSTAEPDGSVEPSSEPLFEVSFGQGEPIADGEGAWRDTEVDGNDAEGTNAEEDGDGDAELSNGNNGGRKRLGTGAIIGISAAAALLFALPLPLCWFCGCVLCRGAPSDVDPEVAGGAGPVRDAPRTRAAPGSPCSSTKLDVRSSALANAVSRRFD